MAGQKYFYNREEAGRLLAEKLSRYEGLNPLVAAIPRGAVGMARIIAEKLKGDLDVVLARKIPSQLSPELAIGSIGESGNVYLDENGAAKGVPRSYVERERKRLAEVFQDMRRMLTPFPPYDPLGRIVIVVDDGLATGSTMLGAVREMRGRKAAKIIAAAAVASPQALFKLRQEAEEVVALIRPDSFMAVGQFFQDFHSVSDEEVFKILSSFRAGESEFVQDITPG